MTYNLHIMLRFELETEDFYVCLPDGLVEFNVGDEVDFVSRFFAPKYNIPEDPVTGSAHCMLTPYWAGRLAKLQLRARQISPRGGNLDCALEGDRVRISGSASEYLKGEISL